MTRMVEILFQIKLMRRSVARRRNFLPTPKGAGESTTKGWNCECDKATSKRVRAARWIAAITSPGSIVSRGEAEPRARVKPRPRRLLRFFSLKAGERPGFPNGIRSLDFIAPSLARIGNGLAVRSAPCGHGRLHHVDRTPLGVDRSQDATQKVGQHEQEDARPARHELRCIGGNGRSIALVSGRRGDGARLCESRDMGAAVYDGVWKPESVDSSTWAEPRRTMPSAAAAPYDRSMILLRETGPRSLIRTRTDGLPPGSVTRIHDPSGSVRCAAVMAYMSKRSPLAVRRP